MNPIFEFKVESKFSDHFYNVKIFEAAESMYKYGESVGVIRDEEYSGIVIPNHLFIAPKWVNPKWGDSMVISCLLFLFRVLKKNKKLLGMVLLTKTDLNITVISHESNHMTFEYIKRVDRNYFKIIRNMDYEERVCYTQDHYLSTIMDILDKNGFELSMDSHRIE